MTATARIDQHATQDMQLQRLALSLVQLRLQVLDQIVHELPGDSRTADPVRVKQLIDQAKSEILLRSMQGASAGFVYSNVAVGVDTADDKRKLAEVAARILGRISQGVRGEIVPVPGVLASCHLVERDIDAALESEKVATREETNAASEPTSPIDNVTARLIRAVGVSEALIAALEFAQYEFDTSYGRGQLISPETYDALHCMLHAMRQELQASALRFGMLCSNTALREQAIDLALGFYETGDCSVTDLLGGSHHRIDVEAEQTLRSALRERISALRAQGAA